MDEKYPRSKLKRQKPSVQNLHLDRRKTFLPTLVSSDTTEDYDGPVAPAVAWWRRELLPAVESLWALTLKSALPYLEDQHWDPVPDLPHPSTARCTWIQLDEQQWCDLGEEVVPLPEPALPSPRILSRPDPLRPVSSQQGPSLQTKPALHTSARQLSPHGHETKRQRSSTHSWEKTPSSAGCSRLGESERKKAGEPKALLSGPVKRQLIQKQVKESKGKEEMVKEKKEALGRIREDGGAAAGGRLQICPMCLLVFPVGFTQMDCDSHLAQCLSEINMDMSW